MFRDLLVVLYRCAVPNPLTCVLLPFLFFLALVPRLLIVKVCRSEPLSALVPNIPFDFFFHLLTLPLIYDIYRCCVDSPMCNRRISCVACYGSTSYRPNSLSIHRRLQSASIHPSRFCRSAYSCSLIIVLPLSGREPLAALRACPSCL